MHYPYMFSIILETVIPPISGIQRSGHLRCPGTFVVAMVDAPTPQDPTNAQIRHSLGGNFALSSQDAQGLAMLTDSIPALSELKQPTPTA
ncbi:hypothetical protein DFH11DRAFT_1592856 [Phellopilus nigrolimitatus]|nr:hypothetical protein DFH11DRAFT_1592856 [Phellopilus nigrolimitatus]